MSHIGWHPTTTSPWRLRVMVLVVGLVLGSAPLVFAGASEAADSTSTSAAAAGAVSLSKDRVIRAGRIGKPGDLARSTFQRTVLFTVDRQSRQPRVFSVDAQGKVRGTLRVRGARVHAPWTLAAGKGHTLWAGDIANPHRGRARLQLYRWAEPRRLAGRHSVSARRYVVRYADGRHHSSALLVDQSSGRVFVVTTDGGVYRLPARPSVRRVNVLQRVARVAKGVVGGSISAHGGQLVLTSATSLYRYAGVGGSQTSVSKAPVRLRGAELARGDQRVLVTPASAPHEVGAVAMTALSPSTGTGSTSPVSTGPITWVPDLDDGFDTLDTKRWRLRDHQAYLRDDATVLAKNVTAQNSLLRVQAKLETVDGRNYTTGDLDTYGKYSMPNYFRVEVRAKVPYEQGMWAAPIWIRPSDGSAGEIDLVETYGDQQARPIVHQTIHTEYGATHRQVHLQTPFADIGGDPLGWHTYVVEKTPGKIVMWVDGVKTAEFNPTNTSWYNTYYEAGKRWSLRSSLQVGGGHGLPDDTTDWSPDRTAMVLDYVKTWVPENS